MELVCAYFLYFLIYSFIGYLCEVVYVSVGTRHLTNRGYLYGPICPIYGCGAVIILLSLSWCIEAWPIVLILGFILTSALEYLVSYLMEIIFHMRWWDYSKKRFNINGRVCLLNSTLFAGLVMILMYLVHPYLIRPLVSLIDNEVMLYSISGVLLVIFLIDVYISTIKNLDKAKLVLELQNKLLKHKYKMSVKRSELDIKLLERLKRISRSYPTLRIYHKHMRHKEYLHEMLMRLEERIKGDE